MTAIEVVRPEFQNSAGETRATEGTFIRWFGEIGIDDIPLVGGKNASLGEMYSELSGRGVKVPNGFAITSEAYRGFLQKVADFADGSSVQFQATFRSLRVVILSGARPGKRPKSGSTGNSRL